MTEYCLFSTKRACALQEALDAAVHHAARSERRAKPGSPEPGLDSRRGWVRKRRQVDPGMVLVVGLGAGVISTAAQLALWVPAGMPVFETLFRDARLTAALILGTSVLPPPSTPRWDVLLVATVIHFVLSIAYALVPAALVGRLNAVTATLGGAAYGLAIYAINMYGFTLLFPWFAVARDWVTLVTHLVFGAALAWGCLLFARRFRKPPK